jgi:hypothetical protein
LGKQQVTDFDPRTLFPPPTAQTGSLPRLHSGYRIANYSCF